MALDAAGTWVTPGGLLSDNQAVGVALGNVWLSQATSDLCLVTSESQLEFCGGRPGS